MRTNREERPDWRHFKFIFLGWYLESVRISLNISKQTLCEEGSFGLSTYYRMLEGYDHYLNFYIRLFIVFSRYCDSEYYYLLESNFLTLACAEIRFSMKEDE